MPLSNSLNELVQNNQNNYQGFSMAKYVFFQGGLGNQMFEYAFMLALRANGNRALIDVSFYKSFQQHNGYELDTVFGVKESLINRKGLSFFFLRLIRKLRIKHFILFDDECYNANATKGKWIFYDGYWQNPLYFNHIESYLKEIFTFEGIDENNLKRAKDMEKCNSVSLHIRRGDYEAFGLSTVSDDYYRKAIEYVREHVKNPVFFVFTDDLYESRSILNKIGGDFIFVNQNVGKDSYKDMFLMTKCKHNIIANSSFSWWGAYLNAYEKKIVLCPQKWLEGHPHLSPQLESWIKM